MIRLQHDVKMIRVYTDGSYKPSTNQGGYAAVITHNDLVIKVLHEGFINTTNNRMEIMGVLAAFKYYNTPMEMEIYSDSSYVVNSIKEKHLDKWIEESDTTKKNLDLWFEVYKLLRFHRVQFFWVKGHDDNEFNELADLYANNSAVVLNPKKDLADDYQN